MRTIRSRVHFRGRATPRLLSIFGIICALVGFTPQRVAAYDWCSNDPVFHFRQSGSFTARELDVQVLIPLQVLPVSGTSTLTVTVPTDVTYREVFRAPLPGFPLQTVFVAGPATGGAKSYPITFAALVPGNDPTIPMQLKITDPLKLQVTTKDGFFGTPVSVIIQLGP